MQKFQPRIIIEEKPSSSRIMSVSFPQTSFIAVTAYQNQEVRYEIKLYKTITA